MCHADLDPTLLKREMDARLKSISETATNSDTAPVRTGPLGWIAAMLAGLLPKGKSHV